MHSIIPFLLAQLTIAAATLVTPPHLNLTAISAKKGASILECWQLSAPFAAVQEGKSTGLVTDLGETGDTSYLFLEAGFTNGLHNAPAVQFVVFVTGLATISVPSSPIPAYILGGTWNSLIIATDTAAVSTTGHSTLYDVDTIILEIPTAGGVVPAHTVLHEGPCLIGDFYY